MHAAYAISPFRESSKENPFLSSFNHLRIIETLTFHSTVTALDNYFQPVRMDAHSSTPPLLEMREISKSFRGVQALNTVQFTLRAGEIHALMGENGAGKSTLIKVLTGVNPPDKGTITLAGKVIAPASPAEAEREGISTVYQEVNLIPTMSVADNVMLGRQPTRAGFLRKGEMRKRAEEALARIGLRIDVGRPLGSCSIAQQQLVAIARALDVKARLLILDEPTSSLDAAEVDHLFKIMRRLRDDGMAILFVTHFLDQVYAVSDRITVLRNGRFVGEYTTAELPRLQLISAMIGRDFSQMEKLREEKDGPVTSAKRFLDANQVGLKGTLNPVSLELGCGEVLGLAGLLGSGRTETAKILFGITPADTGEVKIEGRDARLKSPRAAVRQGLAFCSEDRKAEGIIPHLSVRENMLLALQAKRGTTRKLLRDEQNKIVDHYIRALNIKTADAETPIMNLSGGNQQKVLLARWLALQPSLIILDEPTRGIDVGAKAEIEKLVDSLRKQGMSVLFISSDLEEIVRTCDRVAVLRDRRKVGELSGPDVQANRIMSVIAQHE
jgi:simple sugar transport system ATP-binding protein